MMIKVAEPDRAASTSLKAKNGRIQQVRHCGLLLNHHKLIFLIHSKDQGS